MLPLFITLYSFFLFAGLHVISYDIWFYISHLILHHKYFYYIHKQHHYNLKPTFFYVYTAHWLESPLQMLGIFVPLLFKLQVAPLIVASIYMNIRGLLRHDERGNFAFGNHHMLHHKYIQYNYGEYWIDYLCGTLYPGEKERVYGYIL